MSEQPPDATAEVDVDPRITFASERTFLAWMRTSLALIAGGIAIGATLDTRQRVIHLFIALAPIVLGGFLASIGYRRWRAFDAALQIGLALAGRQHASQHRDPDRGARGGRSRRLGLLDPRLGLDRRLLRQLGPEALEQLEQLRVDLGLPVGEHRLEVLAARASTAWRISLPASVVVSVMPASPSSTPPTWTSPRSTRSRISGRRRSRSSPTRSASTGTAAPAPRRGAGTAATAAAA